MPSIKESERHSENMHVIVLYLQRLCWTFKKMKKKLIYALNHLWTNLLCLSSTDETVDWNDEQYLSGALLATTCFDVPELDFSAIHTQRQDMRHAEQLTELSFVNTDSLRSLFGSCQKFTYIHQRQECHLFGALKCSFEMFFVVCLEWN